MRRMVAFLALLFSLFVYPEDIGALRDKVASNAYVLANVKVFDVAAKTFSGPVSVFVKSGIIVRIDPGYMVNFPSESGRIIEAEGRYVIPGLIDAHAHIGVGDTPAEYCFYMWLANGITAIREVSSEKSFDEFKELRGLVDRGMMDGPKIFLYPIVCTSPRELIDKGADGLKTYANESGKDPASQVEYAKASGIRIASHNIGPLNALELSRKGLTSLEHFFGLPEALMNRRTTYLEDYAPNITKHMQFVKFGSLWKPAMSVPLKTRSRIMGEMIHNGLTIVPTLSVYSVLCDVGYRQRLTLGSGYLNETQNKFSQSDTNDYNYGFLMRWSRQEEAGWTEAITYWKKFLKEFHDLGGKAADMVICDRNPLENLEILSLDYSARDGSRPEARGIVAVAAGGNFYPMPYLKERIKAFLK